MSTTSPSPRRLASRELVRSANLAAARGGQTLALVEQRRQLLAQLAALTAGVEALARVLPRCPSCEAPESCPAHPWAGPLRALAPLLALPPGA